MQTDRLSPGFAAFLILMVLVTAGAFLFRAPRLDQRPMHTDESVHTAKAGELLETGTYVYDPREYHGPTLYYFALPFIWWSGVKTLADTHEWMFRIVPVFFGTALVLILVLVGRGLGRWETLCAGALTAISPAMVFYSRYYIQEIVFVFFTFAAIVSGWRYAQTKRLGWALATGVCLGLMHATKETSILAYAAMAGALALTIGYTRWVDGEAISLKTVNRRHVAAEAILGVIVCLTVLSGFFTHPRGALDAFLTFSNYLNRSGGAGIHDHPWNYYFQILLGLENTRGPHWHERMIVITAAIGLLFALFTKPASGADVRFRRFVAFYTVLLALAYSAIPYKTPWCMLGFLHGMILLAGIGIVALLRRPSNRLARVILALVLLFAAYQLGTKAYAASFTFCADERNPYVYGHTSTDLLHLVQRIEDITKTAPEGQNTLMKVITLDAWPLPWYLRKFTRVGYWPGPIDNPDAPIVIMSAELQSEVEPHFRDTYQTECYGLRPGVLLVMFIRQDLWDAFIKTRI